MAATRDSNKFQQENADIFLLNNLLMGFQFFENYERDIEVLRGNWFNETSLGTHWKKCFFADSLHRLVGTNVRFRPDHGIKKDSEELIHPLRIYISNDNVEAAYDPSILAKSSLDVRPCYQFTVTPCENRKKEKSGFVSLVEFKTFDSIAHSTPSTDSSLPRDSLHFLFKKNTIVNPMRRKSTFDVKPARRLTKTEKFIGLQNREFSSVRFENAKCDTVTPEGKIPHNGYYRYVKPEARLRPKPIYDFRMNNIPQTSHRIPRGCFQMIDVKISSKNSRRRRSLKKGGQEVFFATRTVLNSAAFAGHFCDVFVEKLAEILCFDPNLVNESSVQEEFLIYNQTGTIICVTPVIGIRDWHKHVEINKQPRFARKPTELIWPTEHMRSILKILPCNLVPNGYAKHSEENLDYEKEWKIVFPKAEEYLLLHMMHAHLRCFFFVLAIYKSFIEPEINSASLNPTHILHLLFWRVQKDFLAWPEDRPVETLLNFLKILYKKLQNKSLRDFFLTSRNLFSHSLPKDLHRAQATIKMILDNPVPYVMRAVRNLKSDCYPAFDVSKLNEILTTTDKPEIKKKKPKQKKRKMVSFEDDEERQWRKDIIKQIQFERKAEETMSVDSITIEETLHLDFNNHPRLFQILEMFVSHFVEMGIKSAEHKVPDQALMYLLQCKKLVELLSDHELHQGWLSQNKKLGDLLSEHDSYQKRLRGIKENVNRLKQKCDALKEGLNVSTKAATTIDFNRTNKLQTREHIETSKEVQEKLSAKMDEDVSDTELVEERGTAEESWNIKILQSREDSDYVFENSDEIEIFETKL